MGAGVEVALGFVMPRTLPYQTLATALLFIAACGSSITRTDINPAPKPMPPRPAASVEVFSSGAPARPHVDVAILEVEESSSFSVSDTGEMVSHLRSRAAAMGCDGVVIGGASSRDPGLTDKESLFVDNPRGRKGFFATCIAYTDAPPLMTAR